MSDYSLFLDAAPLTFVITDHPSVEISAGFFFEAVFPECGCDACDEDLLINLSLLESTVFSIVEGKLSETVKRGKVHVILADPNGPCATVYKCRELRKRFTDFDKSLIALRALESGWHPWLLK